MVLPDVKRARMLGDLIVTAWKDEPIPEIPRSCKQDVVFFQPYTKFVAGKRWDEIDLEGYSIGGECWILYLPVECQRYYIAAYLAYAVSWTGTAGDPRFDKDHAFLCLAPALVRLAPHRNEFSSAQQECICSVISFCLEYQEELWDDNIIVFGELLEAQSLWQCEEH